MMSRKILSVCFLCVILCVQLCAQGLRTSVCVVYPECSVEDSLLLMDYAQQIGRIGFVSDASGLRAYAGRSFGSGVLVDGYVLTNRHVVGYAKTAKLVFELHDKTLTYEHCKVVGSSLSCDVAAIEVPADLTELHLLLLSNEAVEDGEDIYAAGFPGLKGEPSWQLTKGMISNSRLNVDGSNYIQHTAAIDPGSSGGPLLRKKDGHYEVIGLNTMKAFLRDRVGMAVSMSDLLAFITTEPDKSDQVLLDVFREVDASLLMDYYRLLPDSMKTVLHDMDVRLPMDRVIALADYYGGVDQLQKKADDKPVVRLRDTDKRLTQNKVGVGDLRDCRSVYVGYDVYWPLKAGTSAPGHMVSVNFDYDWGYFVNGATIGIPMYEDMHGSYISGGDTIPARPFTNVGATFGFRVGVQLPIRLNACHVLVPKITAEGLVGAMFNGGLCIQTPVRVGMDYRYQFRETSLLLGTYYSFVPFFLVFEHNSMNQGLNVRLGVAF